MESFKDIDGYENLYEIGNCGTVRSKDKIALYKGQSYLNGRTLKQEVMKRNRTNYRRVSLSKDSIVKRFQVHRLVGFHFIENPENKPEINHIDLNGENNRVDNLEWNTRKENMQHAWKYGNLKSSQKKATIASAKKLKLRKKIRYNMMVNQINGDNILLKVVSVGRHVYGEFICTRCGEKRKADIDSVLINHSSFRCRSCSSSLMHRKRKMMI